MKYRALLIIFLSFHTSLVMSQNASQSPLAGCCSSNLKECSAICGESATECLQCLQCGKSVVWLPTGPPSGSNKFCLARWETCTEATFDTRSACCPGLECIQEGENRRQCTLRTSGSGVGAGSNAGTSLLSTLWRSNKGLSTWSVFEMLSLHTRELEIVGNAKDDTSNDAATAATNTTVYIYVASEGAAGDGEFVVSESQGYALLITGIILASWDTHTVLLDNDSNNTGTNDNDNNNTTSEDFHSEANRQLVVDAFGKYFRGWQRMCQISTASREEMCGQQALCVSKDEVPSVCLPDWRIRSDLSSVDGTGSAPDGDEDAISGMIFAIRGLEQWYNTIAATEDALIELPEWYDELRRWADASATAFYRYNTVAGNENNGLALPRRLVKLGSCWGGWREAGNNPSYHSPGQYKMFAQYQADYTDDMIAMSKDNDQSSMTQGRQGYSQVSMAEWQCLIDTSYEVLKAVQCQEQGIVPNWARVDESCETGVVVDAGEFSGSGSPQHEFGAEAGRTIWRVAFDAALHQNSFTNMNNNNGKHNQEDSKPRQFLRPLIKRVQQFLLKQEYTFDSCRVAGMASPLTYMDSWTLISFITGPMYSSLILGSDDDDYDDQAAIDEAAEFVANSISESYFSRSWTMLSSLMLSGAVEDAGLLVALHAHSGDDADAANHDNGKGKDLSGASTATKLFRLPMVAWVVVGSMLSGLYHCR